MKKIYGLIAGGLMGLLSLSSANAQVDGVNFTLSPNVSYNWWNQNIALKNSPFYGLRLGVGFGPYVELRGTFEKSVNLKNALQDKSWNPFNQTVLDKIEGMKFDVTRVGGELKLNILSSNYVISPYLTAGGGVQLLGYNPFDTTTGVIEDAKKTEKQLYLTAGAGVRFNLSERVALSLEGRNTRFNMNKVSHLLNPTVDEKAKRWGNWSAIASLDITLGGTSGGYSETGRKYSNLFEDGFRGVKFVLEPGIAYADFSNKLGRADQFFVGGSAGLDFSSLVGIRAFYYQATKEPKKLGFNFNKDLKMYGANLLLRLNQPRGIVPYLTLGAGYLDDKGLIPTNPSNPASGSAQQRFDIHNLFLMGGAGVEIPFSRYVALFGNVNAMLSTDEQIQDAEISNIYTSVMYNAGLRINIGRPAYEPTINNVSEAAINERINDARNEAYKEGLRDAGDKVGESAYNRGLRDGREEQKSKVTRHTIFQREAVRGGEMMTKQQFEEMVDRILYKIRSEESARASKFTQSEMDIIVAALNSQNPQGTQVVATADAVANQQLVNEMRRLVNRMDRLEGKTTTQSTTVPVQRIDPLVTTPATTLPSSTTSTQHSKQSFLKLNRLGVLTGANFGEGTQWVIGVRGYMQIANTNLDFVPELMAGFGKKAGFDLAANVVYNIDMGRFLNPYLGLGLGVYSHGAGLKFGPNFILGNNFKLFNSGELFVDYTARGLFKNNQIAVGYRFVF